MVSQLMWAISCFFVKDHLKYNIKKIGPLIENHELFLEKCNVTFKKPENGKIYVNVWKEELD